MQEIEKGELAEPLGHRRVTVIGYQSHNLGQFRIHIARIHRCRTVLACPRPILEFGNSEAAIM